MHLQIVQIGCFSLVELVPGFNDLNRCLTPILTDNQIVVGSMDDHQLTYSGISYGMIHRVPFISVSLTTALVQAGYRFSRTFFCFLSAHRQAIFN